MLEIYCDSSFNEDGSSFIGIVAIADGVEVHQSTTAIIPAPADNLECERAAISMAIRLARAFRRDHEQVIIYNDNTEAVKEYLEAEMSLFPVEYTPRESPIQSMADRLSRRFPQRLAETHDLCRRPVESFTPENMANIARNGRTVVYLVKDRERSSNTKSCFRLVARTVDQVLSDDHYYCARSGEVKNVKIARDVSADIAAGEIIADLEGSYFLLTDETWGLRLKGGEAYSVLPCEIPHRIICHEVDRSPDNLWRRVARQ
jgi:ribonuclease HI